jgi:outer membrane immunogenic protein
MKRLARISALLLVMSAAVVPAEAQSLDFWTGFYAGLNVGWGWSDEALTISGDPLTEFVIAAGVIPRTLADDPSGLVGGAQAGYNVRIWRLVLGAETDVRGSDIGARESISRSVPQLFPFTTTAEQELDFLGTLRGRVGILPLDGLLVYGTGGFAYGHVHLSASLNTPGCLGVCASKSRSGFEAGWTMGGGVEYAFASRWSARAEYLRYDLGGTSVSVRDPRFPALVQRVRAEFEGNIVTLGVNYRF